MPECNNECNDRSSCCDARASEGFICCRNKGHKGDHMACGSEHALAIWPQETSEQGWAEGTRIPTLDSDLKRAQTYSTEAGRYKKMKIIRIKTCEDCLGMRRKSSWSSPRNIPHCTAENRDLQYNTINGFAVYTGEIPDWCPLEDEE